MKILIRAPKDRATEGTLYVLDGEADSIVYRARCLGRSDEAAATAAGNPERDPVKPLGDLPCGLYQAVRIAPPESPTEATLRSYGPGPRWLLVPAFESTRSGIEIHGGATGEPMPPGALRPTHGCCRVDDATIAALDELVGALPSVPVTVEEYEG